MFILDDQETEKLSDVLDNIRKACHSGRITLSEFKNIRYQINRVLGVIWSEEIVKKFIDDGKFEQFEYSIRCHILNMTRPPNILTFNRYKQRVMNFQCNHPVKDKMVEIISDMQEIIDMVESLNGVDRYTD